ncbi:metal ABC transporter ATP-binding protein [Bacillus horti]|uniref:Zinc transport system ATP-binding protein n=1 Tax=Caldalkalibacillus horti TaxID=77523 RepID=A0ABT9W4C8_9BACI|nr:metal ABC transporter ATP-binding protein [Bacillus horti]MDQ0168103.1 zinc transport system ATP-binding protein [Bacillus horti]
MNKQVAVPTIELKNVSFDYDSKTKVLDQIDLTMPQGDFLGIVGPNGSGKSTLVKLILGLLSPTAGEVKLFGQPVTAFKQWNRIGYVSQKANSFNSGFPATVFEVVASGLFGKAGLFKWLNKKDHAKILRTLDMVGIKDLASRNIGKLSGGQQQRTFIARALVSNPDILILDEPTVGIDSESVDRFYELLEHLHGHLGISILLISHDIGVITNKVSQVACLNKKIHFHGDPKDFTHNQEAILSTAYGHDVRLLEHSH